MSQQDRSMEESRYDTPNQSRLTENPNEETSFVEANTNLEDTRFSDAAGNLDESQLSARDTSQFEDAPEAPNNDDTDDYLSITGTDFTLPQGSGTSTLRSPDSGSAAAGGRSAPYDAPLDDFRSVRSDDAQSIHEGQSLYAGSMVGDVAPSITSTALLQDVDFQFDDFSDEEEAYVMPSVEDAWKESIRSEKALQGTPQMKPPSPPSPEKSDDKKDEAAAPLLKKTTGQTEIVEDDSEDSSVVGAPSLLESSVAGTSTFLPIPADVQETTASAGQALAARVLNRYKSEKEPAPEAAAPGGAGAGGKSRLTAKQRFKMAKLAVQAGRAVERVMRSLDEMRALPAKESAGTVKGYISVDRSNPNDYPTYNYYLQEENGQDRFVLSARKYGKDPRKSKYIISMDPNQVTRRGSGYYGSVESNFVGTKFTIFDRGPKRTPGINPEDERRVLGVVVYEPTVNSTYGSYRKMTALLPNLYKGKDSDGNPLVERWDQVYDMRDMHLLTSKLPEYKKMKDGKMHYCYKWGGRVKLPSTKNFQLVLHGNQDAVVQLFGKMGPNIYACDFTYPLSAHQAFAIAMTSIDSKLCMMF